MRKTALIAAALGLALLGPGCSITSQYMAPADPVRAIEPEPGRAVVVFLRPSGFGPLVTFTVVDQEGRFLGQPGARQYWVSSLPPGEHVFYSFAENADLMRAQLAPGRVYYVLIAIHAGERTGRTRIGGLTPRRQEWASLHGWLRESRQMTVDTTAGQASLDPAEVQRRMAEAREAWNAYPADERAIRILGPTDGQPNGPPR